MSPDPTRSRRPNGPRGGTGSDHGRSTARRPMKRDAATESRVVALEVLREVRQADAYANLVLPQALRRHRLNGRDAAFATELTYGAIRLAGRYDAFIAAASGRAVEDIDPQVLDVLRLVSHQLFALRTPPHAAVSQGVDLATEQVGQGPARFVNAVARKLAEADAATWLERALEGVADGDERLAITESHPAWVVRALRAALRTHGRDGGEIEALLQADNAPPQVTLVARPGLIAPDVLADQVAALVAAADAEPDAAESEGASRHRDVPGSRDGSAVHRLETPAVATPRAGVLAATAVGLPHGDPGRVPAVAAGLAGVQDEGSQLVALVLAEAPLAGPDESWLDLCAGPGGKAALLGAVARERGARVLANESAPHRADLVRRSCEAVADVVSVRVGDGRELPDELGPFDRVLVDAPCTGLGALRRRPEARWRRVPGDVPQLAALQRELLARALEVTRPGGLVAYVTCSPHQAETELVVRDTLKRRAGVRRVDLASVRPDLAAAGVLTPAGALQLWPHRHGTDAMYLALLQVD